MLPKTICTTLTAVPRSSGIAYVRAVDLRARRVPRLEDGGDRAAQLLARVLREVLARLLDVDLAGALDRVVGAEALVRDAVDRLAEHLDEPPVAVARELLVAGRAREPVDGDVVEPDVEDRVHHPRHRDRGTRADGDEQRVVGVAEALAGLLLEPRDSGVDLVVEPLDLASRRHVRAARVGRDREAGRNGDAELRSSPRGRCPCRREAPGRPRPARRMRRRSASSVGDVVTTALATSRPKLRNPGEPA